MNEVQSENNKFYALCYLNNANPLHSHKGWQCSAIFTHYPTKEELMKIDVFQNDGKVEPYDEKLIDGLVSGKNVMRLVYSKDESDWLQTFFEVGIWSFEYGKDMTLWNLFVTGYCGFTGDESRIVNRYE